MNVILKLVRLDAILGPGFETTFRLVTKCEERISQLSVIPGKKAKRNHEVWSHQEEGRTRVALLD